MLYQILALLIWGSSFIAAKYAYTMMDAVWTIQFRLLLSMLVVLPFAAGYLKRMPAEHWRALLLITFSHHIVVLLLQFIGVQYTSAASAVTIVGLEPLLMVFVGHFFFKDKAQPYHWFCGALAFVGVAVLIMGGAEGGHGQISLLGCLLVFLAGLVFCAIYRPTQKLIHQIGSARYTNLSFLLAAPMCVPMTLWLGERPDFANWHIQGVLALLYLGIACSWLAYWLWNKGMNHVSANTSGLLTALEPVFGVIMALVILGERVSLVSGIGIILVMAATISTAIINRQSSLNANAH